MRLTQFGTTLLPELNGVDDFSQSARTNIVPLKYGGIDLDGSEVVLNYKQIQRTATINTDFDDTMDDLAYEGQRGARILKAEMRDGTERQLLAKMNMFSRGAKAQNYTCEQEFGLQWTSMYPYWLATEDEPYWSNHGLTTADGLNTSDANGRYLEGVSSTTETFTLTNNSRVRIPKIKFFLRALGTSGTWGNIRITNNTNRHWIQVDKTITLNSTITRQHIHIDCLSKKVYGAYSDFSGQDSEYNLYNYVTTSPDYMDWMILEPGDNDFTVTSSVFGGGSISRSIITYFSKHYV